MENKAVSPYTRTIDAWRWAKLMKISIPYNCLHRNTTYFFFKHFNFKKAIVLTYHALRTQIKLLQRNKTGLNRDFLKIVNKDNSIVSVVIGALTGFYRWIKLRGKSLEFLHSKPVALTCFKLVIIGGSVKLIEMENRSHFLKKLFGM